MAQGWLSVELKELIRLAEDLNNRDKQELIRFSQSRIKGSTAPIRVIDDIQEQKH